MRYYAYYYKTFWEHLLIYDVIETTMSICIIKLLFRLNLLLHRSCKTYVTAFTCNALVNKSVETPTPGHREGDGIWHSWLVHKHILIQGLNSFSSTAHWLSQYWMYIYTYNAISTLLSSIWLANNNSCNIYLVIHACITNWNERVIFTCLVKTYIWPCIAQCVHGWVYTE